MARGGLNREILFFDLHPPPSPLPVKWSHRRGAGTLVARRDFLAIFLARGQKYLRSTGAQGLNPPQLCASIINGPLCVHIGGRLRLRLSVRGHFASIAIFYGQQRMRHLSELLLAFNRAGVTVGIYGRPSGPFARGNNA